MAMPVLAWPTSLADMETQRRNFALALGVSLFLHAVLLSIHFKLEDVAVGDRVIQVLQGAHPGDVLDVNDLFLWL